MITTKRRSISAHSAAIVALSVIIVGQSSEACTRIFANNKGGSMLVARTMDWSSGTEPVLTVLPRGLKHDGGRAGTEKIVFSDNPLRWTSTYGSVVTTIYGVGTADGINERGLAAHMQYFPVAVYAERDPSKPGLQAAMWAQYALDSSATVAEALANLTKLQVVKLEIVKNGQTQHGTVHVALEDKTGDSAILEYVDGKLIVHHGKQFRVMTNAPAYDEQLHAEIRVARRHREPLPDRRGDRRGPAPPRLDRHLAPLWSRLYRPTSQADRGQNPLPRGG